MPLEKLRTLLALLLKKISTPSRLKKLGFGSRLIGRIIIVFRTRCGPEPQHSTGAGTAIFVAAQAPGEYQKIYKSFNNLYTFIVLLKNLKSSFKSQIDPNI
jgi:hypothetical protein